MIRGDWKITESELVYDNPWISVNHHKVITPGGSNGIYGEVQFKNLAIGMWWSRNLGQRFRNYKLRNYEKNQTRIQFSVQS